MKINSKLTNTGVIETNKLIVNTYFIKKKIKEKNKLDQNKGFKHPYLHTHPIYLLISQLPRPIYQSDCLHDKCNVMNLFNIFRNVPNTFE